MRSREDGFVIDSQRFEEEFCLAGQRGLSTGHLKTRRRRSPRSLLAIGLLALFSLTSVDGPVQAQAISDASAEVFEFDGLTASVEELYQKKLGGSWCTLRVTVKNTGTERVEPTVEVQTKVDGRFQRSVFWSTVVSPPSEEGGVSERSQLIPCWAWQEYSGQLMEFTLRILVDGRALPEVEEDPRVTRKRFLNSAGRQVSGGAAPWRIPKSFGVLVVRTTESEEPTGWRTALREELRQSENMPTIEMNFREASIDQLPTRVEAYESIDRVFLIGVEPHQLVNAQRMALVAAVKLGLRVWVIPGFAGEGNSWIAGDSEPRFRAQTVSDSSGGRQTFFLANPLESDPGEPGDLIVDHGGQQIPGSYCYRDGVGAWLRATSSVGPWSFSESFREIWPQKINEHFDSVVRGDNSGFLSAIDDRYRRNVGAWTILILIFLYIVVAGPGLFLFLKRKGKLPWMLWLQPLVVVLFVLATAAIGMVEFGVTVRQHQTYFFFQEEGEDGAVVVDLKSFYSPTSVNRDVEVDSGFTLPIPRPSAVRQKPLRWSIDPVSPELIGFRTQTWSLNHFSSRRGVNLGKVEIHVDQDKTPIVVNGLPCSLEFATLIRPSSWSPSSRMARQVAPGTHATLSLNRMLEDRWEMDLYRRVRGSLENQWRRSDFYPIAFAELRVSELPTEFLERSSDDCRAFLVLLRRKTSP